MIEDDPNTRVAWRAWLDLDIETRCGSEFASSEDALSNWSRTTADVVLVDLKLPGLGGAECIRRLKRRFPSVRCLVVTVSNDSNSIVAALCAGADGYILKTASPAEFLTAVKDVVQDRAPMTPAISRKVMQLFHRAGTRGHPGMAHLTAHESDVLKRISRGAQNKEIAAQLGVSINAIKHTISNIYRKLEVSSRTEAMARLSESVPGLSTSQ